MSDSEDDYMSLKIDDKSDVRPSLVFNREKRKLDIFKKTLDASKKKQKSVRELEQEYRDKGLKTAISNENKGFKLLEKMGFQAGGALGKSRSGIREPIDIIHKQGTSGIGRETHLKEVFRKRNEQKIQNVQFCEERFRFAVKERKNLSQIKKDFFKAQKVCEELDFRSKIEDPIEDFFWTKETIKKKRKIQKADTTDSDSSEEDDEFEMYITEENLFAIITYLRRKHLYCLYCCITGTDTEDLKENCPGPYRIDHDDEI
nr:G patch domain-containing protein 11 [Leptinotarsa decemlineata]XP_023021337.1 G patch domain-containing protein 11 [Leptinotarsa decemlineata]XP_023021338.1 G patch domain-containing protein 11 [Leptinotarsa decemlineata]XP_023021340.1 G patch domain-containing protein 11 [Leptinotarsa decemlineata]XP_023021341.1 G patch domain-containing protein 11 [Leptinotarsa decemlineata]XP_023021342.1 G patch domain-containing protein 11 [Leptinotarsa decemlineata]